MKKTLVIRYVSWASHNYVDRRLRWEAAFEGKYAVHDWGTKEQHIQEAQKNGWYYKVLRQHRNGSVSVIESNCL